MKLPKFVVPAPESVCAPSAALSTSKIVVRAGTLIEGSGVGVVALDRDIRASVVADGGRAVNLQVVEVLRSRAANRAGIVCCAGESDRGRAAIHSSGTRDEVVANCRGYGAEICCRTGVVQREVEEARIAGKQLNSACALESDCSSPGIERSGVGPIAAEGKVKAGADEDACGDIEIARDGSVALQSLVADS